MVYLTLMYGRKDPDSDVTDIDIGPCFGPFDHVQLSWLDLLRVHSLGRSYEFDVHLGERIAFEGIEYSDIVITDSPQDLAEELISAESGRISFF